MTFGKRETENWEMAGQVVRLDHFWVERPRWVAILIPGPWESAEVLHPIAEALNVQGIGAIALHLPADYGQRLEFSAWIDLIVAACERAQNDRHKLALLGIGLGGTVAYYAAAKGAAIDGLWLTAMGDPRRAALRARILGTHWPPLLTTLGMQWLSPAIGHRRWLPPGVAARDMTSANNRDQAQGDPVAVPLHSVRWLSSFLTHAPAIEPEEFRRCRVVLAAPTADRWLQLEPSLDFYRRLPGDKHLHMLDGAGHLPVDDASAALVASAVSSSTT